MKPHIYWTYYPKSRRGYWRVTEMPPNSWNVRSIALRWQAAHDFATMLNRKINTAIAAGRDNK